MVRRAAGLTLDAVLGALAASLRAALDAVRARPVAAFLAMAFAFTWTDWLSIAWTGQRVVPGRLPTDMAGMAGPALAAFAVTAIGGGEAGLRELGGRVLRLPLRSPWFWLLAPSPLLVALAVAAARSAVDLPVPPLARFASYPGLPAMPVLTVLDVVLLGVGFGQEIGWRGFALPRLQRRAGPLGGAVLVAVPWGAWLLPLVLLHGPAGGLVDAAVVGRTAALVVASSVVLAFVAARTQGSVPAAAFWHGSLRWVTGSAGGAGPVGDAVFWAVLLGAGGVVAAELWARRSRRTLLVPDVDGPPGAGER